MWLRNFIKSTSYFLFLFLVFLSVGGYFLSTYTKDVLLLAINSRYSAIGDVFFKYFTHMGDGNMYLFITFITLLFVSKYKAIVMLFSYGLSSIVAQIIKHNYLPGQNHRPRAHFWLDSDRLHFVDGVEILTANSFPSGHTTSAFAMFLVFSYLAKNQMLSIVFFLMAILVGYSRMYLAMHFFADVYAGAIIGLSMTILSIYLAEKVLKLSERETLQKGYLR